METIRVRLLTLIAVVFVLAWANAPALAQPSQESLLKAWEQVQKSDPDTLVFEKIAEGRYRFKTGRFPFDGELKVLKVSVEDPGEDYNYSTYGVVEYDLPGLSEEVKKKYERSYSKWQGTNTLYFDKEAGSWLSSEQRRAKMAARRKEEARLAEAQNRSYYLKDQATYWLPLVALACFLTWFIRRLGLRRQRDYMNRATTHMQTVEELLERIAAAVENNGKAGQ